MRKIVMVFIEGINTMSNSADCQRKVAEVHRTLVRIGSLNFSGSHREPGISPVGVVFEKVIVCLEIL